MKARWFMAVVLMAVAPFCFAQQDLGVYKTVGDSGLHMLYSDAPIKRAFSGPSPAVVYFFGGGWNIGTPVLSDDRILSPPPVIAGFNGVLFETPRRMQVCFQALGKIGQLVQ